MQGSSVVAATDRSLAGTLAALAEAPDFRGAASFLLAQFQDITGAQRGALLRIDDAAESLKCIASVGFPDGLDVEFQLADLSNPAVVSALSLTAIRGHAPFISRPFGGLLKAWTALPLAQPRRRRAIEMLSARRAAEQLSDQGVELFGGAEQRFGAIPGGVVLLDQALE